MENSTSNSLKDLRPGELEEINHQEWKAHRKKTRFNRYIVWTVLGGCVIWEIIWGYNFFQTHEVPSLEEILGIHFK